MAGEGSEAVLLVLETASRLVQTPVCCGRSRGASEELDCCLCGLVVSVAQARQTSANLPRRTSDSSRQQPSITVPT
jgi:hypothetical protein